MELLIIINNKTILNKSVRVRYIVAGVTLIILTIVFISTSSLLLSIPNINPAMNDIKEGITFIWEELNGDFEIQKSFSIDESAKLIPQAKEFINSAGNGIKDFSKMIYDYSKPAIEKDLNTEREILNELIEKAINYLKG